MRVNRDEAAAADLKSVLGIAIDGGSFILTSITGYREQPFKVPSQQPRCGCDWLRGDLNPILSY
ncbi:hypothetical protein [Chelativorans sp. AA-79]|uniref:hypothetical protein n=1 Tax=Chelativorans sp. AA-79 TaxID=3028735 RepID=UPI0023F9A03D|nr:hypothetical protein [Chelativorans sp. AA-79]WEX10716.1 hypothetical protein PVE73_07175 [Chelativorans sp. AA-79]